ncbi:MAG TPA: 3-oxoacyl-ACP synthase, partial [Desulfobacteraceae bacterium]|nr:3-oxoacyl-ACP synthase [Desulfobacteraceae bacterium]
VLLESYESARKRGADILAEVIGFSCNNNGGDLVLPNRNGITQTIKLGLKDAAVSPDAVDFISAHATATKHGDAIEAQATGSVYGKSPMVSGLKSYTGHTMGSCGVIESIMTLYMMQEGFIVPTLNLDNVDEKCAMIQHVREIIEADIRIAGIQNFAFGGVNTCLFLKKP